MHSGYINFNGYLNFSSYLYGCGYLYGNLYGSGSVYVSSQMGCLAGAALQAQGKLKEAAEAYAAEAKRSPESPAALSRDLLHFVRHQLRSLKSSRLPAARHKKGGKKTHERRPPLLISIPVWGKSYIDSMGSLLLRTLLAPGNLPAIAGAREIVIEIVTRESDARAVEALPALRDAAALAKVRIVRWPDRLFRPHPHVPDFHYRLFGAMHHCSIMRACADGGMDVMPVCADHVFSSDALGTIDAYLDSGYKMVLSAALRIDKRRWAAGLLDEWNGGSVRRHLEIPPRQLVDYAVRYMHPVTRRLIVSDGEQPFGPLPFPLLFPQAEGFTAHSFVLHPIAVSADLVRRQVAYDFNTVDGAFLSRILPDERPDSKIKILGENDEAHIFEASEHGNLQEERLAPCFHPEAIARYFFDWRSGQVEPLYKTLFRTPIRFRTGKERLPFQVRDNGADAVVPEILCHIDGWERDRRAGFR